jgi:hypothetical protein
MGPPHYSYGVSIDELHVIGCFLSAYDKRRRPNAFALTLAIVSLTFSIE